MVFILFLILLLVVWVRLFGVVGLVCYVGVFNLFVFTCCVLGCWMLLVGVDCGCNDLWVDLGFVCFVFVWLC